MTAELRALNAKFIHNFVTNDVPSHDAILHKDFTCINAAGGRFSRADYLKYWATGFDPERIVYWDYRDELIDVFGSTALRNDREEIHQGQSPALSGRAIGGCLF
jgi:hypothetical protein